VSDAVAAGEGSPVGRAPGAGPGGGARAGISRFVVRVEPELAEAALARLLDAFPAGLEERGAGEFVVYGEPPRVPGLIEVREEAVPEGWEIAYHAHLTRVVAGRFAVRPPWVAGEEDDLVIDPGAAFGAGTHPTTRMCLELLPEGEGPFADWGSGTGVLALAAARLGFSPVFAIDLDAAPINAAQGVQPLALDLTREQAPYAPVVAANLTSGLLQAVATVQRRPELLIASGFLAGQELSLWDLRERERRELDGWAAVVLA
jgi:ribosomal protein L11 methyltransferase